MSKMFSPMLAPNSQVDLSTLKYSLLSSTKLDGIRCIIKDGHILSRSLKPIRNEQIRGRLEPLRHLTTVNNIILDGELFSPNMTFQQITHYVMTEDLGNEQLPKDLKFYCFDMITDNNMEEPFNTRTEKMTVLISMYKDIAFPVAQREVKNQEEVATYFEEMLEQGFEGLMLRNPFGRYKQGRATERENLIYKVKPFVTFDTQIIDVVQSTEVNDGVERTTNELGRSVTSKKKDDRHLIEKASAFMVEYEGNPLKVTLAMPDSEKIQIWGNRASYIGRTIEYKGMIIGAKHVPRHPVMVRFRTDKDK